MRVRIVVPGIVAGLFCFTALWFPWYMVEPGGIVSGWAFQAAAESLPVWFPAAVYVFCALTIFSFGWVSARWDWSKTWRSSLLAGTGSGLIAGCIIYDLIGAFRFGLLGQAELLRSYYLEAGQNQNGLALVFETVMMTEYLLYLNFIVLLTAGALIGGMGGLISAVDLDDVWGKPPRETGSWLYRLPAYTLTLTGIGLMIFIITYFGGLQEILNSSMAENALSDLQNPPSFVFAIAYLASYALIFPPTGLTWGWIVRDWQATGYWNPLHGIWFAVSLVGVGWAVGEFIQKDSAGLNFAAFNGYPLNVFLYAVVTLLGMGFLGGYISENPARANVRYTVYDWLGYGLTQGIFGGTQAFIIIPAFSLVLMMVPGEYLQYLRQAGFAGLTPAEQAAQLFRLMSGIALGLFFISLVVGWLFALVVLVFRKLLRVERARLSDEASL